MKILRIHNPVIKFRCSELEESVFSYKLKIADLYFYDTNKPKHIMIIGEKIDNTNERCFFFDYKNNINWISGNKMEWAQDFIIGSETIHKRQICW